jgi:uncharacterized protein YbjT (DUF2867 family)
MGRRILVAGAGGALGTRVVAALKERAYWVRALARHPDRVPPGADDVFVADLRDPASLRGACEGIEHVFSSAGASLSLQARPGSGTFPEVDYVGNVHLLWEAQEARVAKFTYVSVFSPRALGALEYLQAHEAFVEELAGSGLAYAVVRPTGFFSAYRVLLDLARKGVAPLIGDGSARTNPIHEQDLAQVCVEALEGEETEVAVGGPEVLSRRRMFELAFEAVGRKPRFVRVPARLVDVHRWAVARRDRRLAALVAFLKEVNRVDVVAPPHGERRLGAFLRESADVPGRKVAA